MQFINAKTTIATIDRELAAYKEGARIMDYYLHIAADRIKGQGLEIANLEREVSDLKASRAIEVAS